MSIREVVLRELKAQGASEQALDLWPQICAAFEGGGPESVKALIQENVRAAKKRGGRQIREMRSAAAASPPRKARKKRPSVRHGR